MGALLSVCHDVPELHPAPEAVTAASEPSANYHLGILCLERPFVAAGADGGAARAAASETGPSGRSSRRATQTASQSAVAMQRTQPAFPGARERRPHGLAADCEKSARACARGPSRRPTADLARAHWSALARLYTALDETPLVQHIYETRLAGRPETKLGLQYEFTQDLRRAYDTYSAGTGSGAVQRSQRAIVRPHGPC